jgi:hypothetical protein
MKNEGKKPKDFPIPIFEDDCDRPACADTVSILQSAMARVGKQKKMTEEANPGSFPVKVEVEYPPGKEAIGSSTWTLVSYLLSVEIYLLPLCSLRVQFFLFSHTY